MRDNYKIELYRFINGEYPLKDFEKMIYSHDDLDSQIGSENYLRLIGFDFKDNNSHNSLIEFLFDSIVTIADFLTWKIRELLIDFIENPDHIKNLLDEFYCLTCDAYNSQGEIVKGFKFLQNLGMNNFYWMDQGYLKTNYGKKWQIEYKKHQDEFEYYHEQLKPIAAKVLESIDSGKVKINGQGDYEITDLLKTELESDQIFELEHKK
ncbi:hypothetical protein [Aestuariivivens insulae]|uniref:hypothetical protein n=1 Tax=Aestuariivivens insulae TaxID=1621988 RepID=UPI001F56CFCD|nr:hypothetical protein [Aestuariivivens insulae]